MKVFTGISALYTPFERLEQAAIAVRDGRISWMGPEGALPAEYRSWPREDLGGRGVLPGLVDAHTHLVYAGSRLEEYLRRAQGESYEAFLEAGGGIHRTVRATQAASEEELLNLARARLRKLLAGGVTTVEIKSGYGLTVEHEIRLLRVIRRLGEEGPCRVFPTFLAHVIPTGWEREAYIQAITEELIPEVARGRLAEAVDVFCDRGGFTLDETRQILEAALRHGLRIKAHAEQFERTGATRLLSELGGLSADHLEATIPEDWKALAQSGTVGVILPVAAVVLRKPLPDARRMWDAGVKVAVATDHNPGSSPVYSLLLALQLAVALGGLSVEEALVAGTANAALALGKPELGRLINGAMADFLVVNSREALELFYWWGDSMVHSVYVAGERVYPHQ
ncbi:MAG: imidazolonepropionase [Armatimonadota bacterium]|nr:imidazolonepropionase [Armatimonadota bacterium]